MTGGGRWSRGSPRAGQSRNAAASTSSIDPEEEHPVRQPSDPPRGRVELLHANAFAVCARTTTTNAAPEAAARAIPEGNGAPGRHPNANNEAKKAPISKTASVGPATANARIATTLSSNRPRTGVVDVSAPATGGSAPSATAEKVSVARSSTRSHHGQRERDPSAREGPHGERRELGHVVGEVIREELLHVVERHRPCSIAVTIVSK